MGSIISLFSSQSSNKTIKILDKLSSNITKYEKKRSQVKKFQEKLIKRLFVLCISVTIVYSISAYTILPSILSKYNYTGEDISYLELLLLWLPVLIFPALYIFNKKLISKFYNWRLKRWDKKISSCRSEKKTILDNVMDNETFNNAMKIFKQFDPIRMRQNFTSAKLNATVSNISSEDSSRHIRFRPNATINDPSKIENKPKVVKPKPKRFLERKIEDESSFEIGPAVPKLDEDELKEISKKQGLIVKKQPLKITKSKRKEKNEKKIIMPVENQDKVDNFVKPTLPAITPKSPNTKLTEAMSTIKDLQMEIDKLKRKQNEQISVAGKIAKSYTLSDRSKSSRAELINKNRKEIIKNKRREDRTKLTKNYSMTTLGHSLQDLTRVENFDLRKSESERSVASAKISTTPEPITFDDENSYDHKQNDLSRESTTRTSNGGLITDEHIDPESIILNKSTEDLMKSSAITIRENPKFNSFESNAKISEEMDETMTNDDNSSAENLGEDGAISSDTGNATSKVSSKDSSISSIERSSGEEVKKDENLMKSIEMIVE